MKGFILKEFLHIFRDLRTMFILFGMPIAQVLLFGYAITNEIKNADIAFLDHSKDHVTEAITHKMLSSGYFQLNDQLEKASQIEPAFRKGKIKISSIQIE